MYTQHELLKNENKADNNCEVPCRVTARLVGVVRQERAGIGRQVARSGWA